MLVVEVLYLVVKCRTLWWKCTVPLAAPPAHALVSALPGKAVTWVSAASCAGGDSAGSEQR